MQKPTVGRIVHYTPTPGTELSDGGPWAALVTFVSAIEQSATSGHKLSQEDAMPLVNLVVFDPHGGAFFPRGVEFSEEPKPGCWSWPPRV